MLAPFIGLGSDITSSCSPPRRFRHCAGHETPSEGQEGYFQLLNSLTTQTRPGVPYAGLTSEKDLMSFAHATQLFGLRVRAK